MVLCVRVTSARKGREKRLYSEERFRVTDCETWFVRCGGSTFTDLWCLYLAKEMIEFISDRLALHHPYSVFGQRWPCPPVIGR
jgi:hypothetical protein